jgi:hypothetical protein
VLPIVAEQFCLDSVFASVSVSNAQMIIRSRFENEAAATCGGFAGKLNELLLVTAPLLLTYHALSETVFAELPALGSLGVHIERVPCVEVFLV